VESHFRRGAPLPLPADNSFIYIYLGGLIACKKFITKDLSPNISKQSS
jgi:hypothetical protein